MGPRLMILLCGPAAVIALGLSAAPAAGQEPGAFVTAWGHPDLQGVWTSMGEANVPFERPAEFGDKAELEGEELAQWLEEQAAEQARTAPLGGGATGGGPVHWYEWWGRQSPRTSLVIDPPDGRVPSLTPAAEARETRLKDEWAQRLGERGPADSWEDRELWDRCIMRPITNAILPSAYNANFQIVQSPDHVVILYEIIHDARIIPLDNATSGLPSHLREWWGDSRGRWEGESLVVETTNFKDLTDPRMSVRINDRGSGDGFNVIERFTRIDAHTVRYELTREDPQTWTRPWTIALNLKSNELENAYILEYACHEGNIGMENILSGARVQERQER
jgi:hypothetical protein